MLLGLWGGRGSGCLVLISLSSSPALFYAGTPSRGASGAQGSSRQVSFIPRLWGGGVQVFSPQQQGATGGRRGLRAPLCS